MQSDQIRNVYDRHSGGYDGKAALLERFVTREMRQQLGTFLHGLVLEVAVGTGLSLPYYSPAVIRVTGIDLSMGMLANARQRAQSIDLRFEPVQMNAERLAFRDESFDCVVVSEALCTIPRPEVALAEMFRVCRSTGTAVFLEHVRSGNPLLHLVQRAVSPLPERQIGCHWTRDTVTTIRDAGFDITSDRSRLFDVFHLVVARRP